MFCEVCGTLNLLNNKYCTHCGNKLINESDNVINNFETFFSQTNKDLLANASIPIEDYYEILEDIFKKANYTKIIGKTPKEKILNFASIFTLCRAKSRGIEFGSNFGNVIYYDDRLDESIQIATIIHELSHCLLFEIFTKILSKILKVDSSSTLEAFVWYFLTNFDDFNVMNEYCAHTVEGRFVPYGYQNYGSFNDLISQVTISETSLKRAIILANNFANEIIIWLEKFIDKTLRNDIKIQFRKDLKKPSYEAINLETTECYDLDKRERIILKSLYLIFEEVSNEEDYSKLYYLKKGFETSF